MRNRHQRGRSGGSACAFEASFREPAEDRASAENRPNHPGTRSRKAGKFRVGCRSDRYPGHGVDRLEVDDRRAFDFSAPSPNPGGGYLLSVNDGASENLIENNIIWYGNKVAVFRGSGGGNVYAYNFDVLLPTRQDADVFTPVILAEFDNENVPLALAAILMFTVLAIP